MRIVQLRAENFKRLRAVQITPEGDLVTIGGNNGEGKSSVLDAIWVALAGRAAAPPRPVRAGEEQCVIELDLGAIKITRTFNDKGDRFTDTVKVESAEGLRYNKPQEVLDALIGAIGFDPLDFARQKPERQAEMLLDIVPLPIDLEEYQALDDSDFAKRREVNREVESLKSQVAAIPVQKDFPDPVDVEALTDQLGKAADTNAAINREEQSREQKRQTIDDRKANVGSLTARIANLEDQIATTWAEIEMLEKGTAEREAELKALPALDEPVDTDTLRQQIRDAQATNEAIVLAKRRETLAADLAAKTAESDVFTAAMAKREKERREALAGARMPIAGLAIAINEKGKPVVEFGGVPFEQISTAEQIRASTAIAMAANPELRVLRIKDGAMLDKASLAMIGELAAAEDFQLWIEVVGEGEGVGFIMEDGLARDAGTAKAEPKTEKPKADKSKGTAEGAQSKTPGQLL